MTLTFAAPSAVAAEFWTDLGVFGSLVVVITLAFQFAYRDSPLAMSFKARGFLALVGLAGVWWYSYASSYRQFVGVDATESEIQLTFVGPHARRVVIPRSDIRSVTYGLSDRGGSRCRLTVEARSSTYHSAWVPNQDGVCRRRRDDLLLLWRR